MTLASCGEDQFVGLANKQTRPAAVASENRISDATFDIPVLPLKDAARIIAVLKRRSLMHINLQSDVNQSQD